MSLKKHLLYAGGALLLVSSSISLCTVTDVVSDIRKRWLSGPKPTANTSVTYDPSAAGDGTADNPSLSIGSNPPRADRLPLPSLAEVLRLDVTVEWVLQRWPRVTTGLPQLQLQGYRVPLVTGTKDDGRGRLADLLLQRPAAGAANHASRHDRRSESSGELF